jgi:hypothetical protein
MQVTSVLHKVSVKVAWSYMLSSSSVICGVRLVINGSVGKLRNRCVFGTCRKRSVDVDGSRDRDVS